MLLPDVTDMITYLHGQRRLYCFADFLSIKNVCHCAKAGSCHTKRGLTKVSNDITSYLKL